MNKLSLTVLTTTALVISGCSGGSGNPGYFFQILFIILPLILIGHYLHKKLQNTNESLYIIEGQLKRIITKLEKIEGNLNTGTSTKSGKSDKKEDR